MQAAHTITWLAKHWRLPVGPPPTTPVVVTDPSLSSTLDHCGTQWHKLGGRVGDTAASKELWGAGVRSTKAAQLHSIGQLAGWVGVVRLARPSTASRLATASLRHEDSPTVVHLQNIVLCFRAFQWDSLKPANHHVRICAQIEKCKHNWLIMPVVICLSQRLNECLKCFRNRDTFEGAQAAGRRGVPRRDSRI